MEQVVVFSGERGQRLAIHVSGYERENASNNEDANWLRCSAVAEVGSFQGCSDLSLMTHDFARLASSLSDVMKSETDAAHWDTDEDVLSLSVETTSARSARLSGTLRDIDHGASISFSFEIGMTILERALVDLQDTLSVFPQRRVQDALEQS